MGCIVCGAIALFLFLKIENSDVFVAAFTVLSVLALFYLRKVKDVIVTRHALIIDYVFLPVVRTYRLVDIEEFDEEQFELTATTSIESKNTFHKGRRTIVKFKNTDDTVLLDSYEIQDYYVLVRHLKKLTRKLEAGFVGDPIEYGEFEQQLHSRRSFWLFGIMMLYVAAAIVLIVNAFA